MNINEMTPEQLEVAQKWIDAVKKVVYTNFPMIDTAKFNNMQKEIENLGNKTVNKKAIKNNPVLDGTDLLIGWSGNFIDKGLTVAQTAQRFDELLTTQII